MQCPSCDGGMQTENMGGETLERCGSCGGEFCSHQALRRFLTAHASPAGANPKEYVRPSPLSDPVRYRKCPSCRALMLRKNFRDSSGIIVDVCAAHGIWFDQGELGKVFEFAETGALAKAERDSEQRAASERRLREFGQALRAAGSRHYVGGVGWGSGVPVEWIADLVTLIPDVSGD